METEPLVILGETVKERRKRLGWPTRQDFADGIDLTYRVLTDLENGNRRLGDKAYSQIEDALEWRRGSIDAILAGGQPTVTRSSAPPQYQYQYNEVESAASPKMRRMKANEERAIPLRLALALAVAADDAETAADYLQGIEYDEDEPGEFDVHDFENTRDDVAYKVDQVCRLAIEVAERAYGGRAQLEIALQADRERRNRKYESLFEMVQAGELAPEKGKAPALPEGEKQDDYDLAGGWAGRTVPGPTDAEKRHAAQDDAAEAPDQDGPDDGA